jgi:tetratricopeptide (TPR) repeat protein
LALASCVVTFLAQSQGQAVAPLEAFPPAARLANALLAYAGYLGKMLWPTRLAVYYPHRGTDFSVAGALAAGGLLLGVTGLVLAQRRRRPYLPVGWLWYLGTLVPVIGLVQVGGQALADRYTYVPLIGVFLMLTWGAADVAATWRLPRPALAAAAAAVLCACAVLTWVQVGYWKSSLRLWEHTTAVTEENGLAHLNLGACYDEQRMLSDARREYEKAVALGPGRADPHGRLATVLAELGLWEPAAAEYRRAIDLDPDAAWPHINLGRALMQLGRPEEALKAFRKAGDLDPAYAPSPGDLGAVFAELGRTEEAIAEYRRALDQDPGDARPHAGLGRLLQEEGRLDEALAEYRRALELGDQQAWPLLQACERQAVLRTRLPGLIAGHDRPADVAERLAFADVCRQPAERRYALAARLYAEAFAADPKPADDLRAAHRFHAAESAAAAGCGQGQDAGPLGGKEKLRLRRQALEWLRADLAAWNRQADVDGTGARVATQRALRVWQRSAALAGVRDPAALAELPADEREAWQKLWQHVTAVLAGERPR